ncbi:MAG: DUF2798 domain-containing protein [Coriobacteriia bacterium]|nr:DUF2798 domain-containing protein [Coriobacteriia bacterium]
MDERNAHTEPEPTEQPQPPRYTYADCLQGRVKPPAPGAPGKMLFTFLMVGGMVTFMVTFNGLRHADWNLLWFLTHNLWMYPVIMAIGLLVRMKVGDAIVGAIAPRLIDGRITGFPKNLAMTVLNVTAMCPIMCGIVTFLLNGPDGFLLQYATAVPISFAVACLVNLLVVGPAVKLLHAQVITSAQGINLLLAIEKNLRVVAAFFGD